MKIIITIDTEGDNQWDPSLPRSTENIRFIPRFQALCDRYGFPPTYLCTYEVAAAPAFDEILLPLHASGRAEIGAHLHPWTNPPFSAMGSQRDGCRLSVGAPGRSLREEAGVPDGACSRRSSASASQLPGRTLGPVRGAHSDPASSLGYIVDCSVTPLVNLDRPGRARARPGFFGGARRGRTSWRGAIRLAKARPDSRSAGHDSLHQRRDAPVACYSARCTAAIGRRRRRGC